MKQFKQLFQQNAQLLGLGITNNYSECSTLRNSFSDYFYTERSMISEANEETNEKKRNKINHQLSILQGSLMGKKQENSVKKRKIKYMRDENIKPKQINVTSKQLHQIRRFDPKLYEEYLSLYHEYKLKTKINEQTKLVLERYRLQLKKQEQTQKTLLEQINILERQKENKEQKLENSKYDIVKEIKKKLTSY